MALAIPPRPAIPLTLIKPNPISTQQYGITLNFTPPTPAKVFNLGDHRFIDTKLNENLQC